MSALQIEIAAALCRVVAAWDALTGGASRKRGTLIFPPTGSGSLGDEAMVAAIAGEMSDRGRGPVTVFARGRPEDWPEIPGIDHLLPPLPGGLRGLMDLIGLLRRQERVFAVGADCIDGHYSVDNSLRILGVARLGGIVGAKSTVVGSSYKPGAAPETAKAIRSLGARVRMCARDPVSRERMISASGREVELVADAAFMLKPLELPGELAHVKSWVESARERGRLLGVNFNRQVIKRGGAAEVDRLYASYLEVLRSRLESDSGLSVLMLPHDYRGEDSDHVCGERLAADLGASCADRVLVTPARRMAGELKWLAGRCHAVLTGRMHLAIAALGLGTPVACVSYQGKFEGLYRHFGLDGGLIDPEQAVDPHKLGPVLDDVLARCDELAQRVENKLPEIKALSRKNLGLDAE